MKLRTLILAGCILLSACEAETTASESPPEVRVITVQETGKIAAAWEAEAAAYEVVAENNLRSQKETKEIMRGSSSWSELVELHRESEALHRERIVVSRERAAEAEAVSLEEAVQYAWLAGGVMASLARESAEEYQYSRSMGDYAKEQAAEAEAWERAARAWKEVVAAAVAQAREE